MKTILVDAWNTFVTEDGIDLKMQQLLDAYPNPKIILTNANKQECITFGIVNMPYEVFSLSHQPNKTDADYFTKMFNHFGLTSDNVIYFEHNKDAVEAAKSKGITTFHYSKNDGLEPLSSFLQSNLNFF
jgi:FMN phosphatase YigB (HAD superfamily)